MKTTITAFAALLLAGASQAAFAQDREHDRDHGGERPAAQPAPNPAAPHQAGPAPAVPQARGRFAALPPSPPPVAPPAPAQGGGPRYSHGGGAPNNDGRGVDRHGGPGPGGGPGSGPGQAFAPNGTAPGDRRYDRRDAPREVVPPGSGERGSGERGWDRDHDGHGPGANDNRGRDQRFNDRRDPRFGDHRDGRRGEPPHWERGRYPPTYWSPQRFRVSPYRAPYGFFVRSWGFGDFLPRGWYGEPYWIDDFIDYDLPYPPPGYEWVRVGPDALMVDRYTGRIIQVVRGIFW